LPSRILAGDWPGDTTPTAVAREDEAEDNHDADARRGRLQRVLAASQPVPRPH